MASRKSSRRSGMTSSETMRAITRWSPVLGKRRCRRQRYAVRLREVAQAGPRCRCQPYAVAFVLEARQVLELAGHEDPVGPGGELARAGLVDEPLHATGELVGVGHRRDV